MAHKTLIGGTAYDVTGGNALIGGTSYGISKGRTLVGGTGYDISFGTWTDRFCRLMANATLVASGGRNSSSESYVRLSMYGVAAGVYYIFVVYQGKVAIVKVIWDGTAGTSLSELVTARGGGNSYYTVYYNSGSYFSVGYYNPNTDRVTQITSINGAGIFAFSFSGFLEANIDSLLSQFSIQSSAYRDTSSRDWLYVDDTTTNALLVQCASYIGLSYPFGTVIFGNYATNPSLLDHQYNRYYVTPSGTSRDYVYGGNIIEL